MGPCPQWERDIRTGAILAILRELSDPMSSDKSVDSAISYGVIVRYRYNARQNIPEDDT